MRSAFLLVLGLAFSLAAPASAQLVVNVDPTDLTDASQVTRLPAELSDVLRVPVPDRDVVDSALVFTSKSGTWSNVKCVALDQRGRKVGKVWTRVPPHGMRIVFASDATADKDVIASVRCASRNRMVASGFLLAPSGITSLPTEQHDSNDAVRMHFPVVATY